MASSIAFSGSVEGDGDGVAEVGGSDGIVGPLVGGGGLGACCVQAAKNTAAHKVAATASRRCIRTSSPPMRTAKQKCGSEWDLGVDNYRGAGHCLDDTPRD